MSQRSTRSHTAATRAARLAARAGSAGGGQRSRSRSRSRSRARDPAGARQETPEPLQQPQGHTAAGEAHGWAESDAAADATLLRAQLGQIQQTMARQQAALEEQRALVAQQSAALAQLRADPPPQGGNAAPAGAVSGEAPSRFARKEPRAQDLREYDGAPGAKLDDWLQELALATQLYELNPREVRTFAVSRLRGPALQWWLAMGESERAAITSADGLAAALRGRFQPVTAARAAREQLDRLQQGSRGVNEYIAEFQRLRTLLPSMAEEDALHAFERGLRRELAEKLRVEGVTTVQAAIALAARVGGLLQAAGSAAAAGRASVHQMDGGSDGDASLEDRVTRSVLNALSARGIGAKTQTLRGYEDERAGRGGGRGGRGGGRQGGNRAGGGVPGVPPEVVEQRRAAGQCFRCGSGDHQSRQCPNAVSAVQQGK